MAVRLSPDGCFHWNIRGSSAPSRPRGTCPFSGLPPQYTPSTPPLASGGMMLRDRPATSTKWATLRQNKTRCGPNPEPRDVLEGGNGGPEGGGGVGWDPPPPRVPLWSLLAVSLKHWKGRGGGGSRGGYPSSSYGVRPV